MMKRLALIAVSLGLVGAVVLPATVAAQPALTQLIPQPCLDDQHADQTVPCDANQLLLTVVNFSQILLGVLGSVTLLVFIYGGIVWLTSGGNAQRVEHGRQVFEGAVIGLAIIFGSWLIINFMVAALTGRGPGEDAVLFPGEGGLQRAPLEIPGAPTSGSGS